MEPLKPSLKKQILESNPHAAPEDVEEYERLLSVRFTIDPDLPGEPRAESLAQGEGIEARLKQLYEKIFLKKPG